MAFETEHTRLFMGKYDILLDATDCFTCSFREFLPFSQDLFYFSSFKDFNTYTAPQHRDGAGKIDVSTFFYHQIVRLCLKTRKTFQRQAPPFWCFHC
ncbi:MAG TPA: hypothetical protein VEZ17_14805 [Chitinophagaceae bacterium]|nr:hypothetical protein [Chitinophagaceae bacterium]